MNSVKRLEVALNSALPSLKCKFCSLQSSATVCEKCFEIYKNIPLIKCAICEFPKKCYLPHGEENFKIKTKNLNICSICYIRKYFVCNICSESKETFGKDHFANYELKYYKYQSTLVCHGCHENMECKLKTFLSNNSEIFNNFRVGNVTKIIFASIVMPFKVEYYDGKLEDREMCEFCSFNIKHKNCITYNTNIKRLDFYTKINKDYKFCEPCWNVFEENIIDLKRGWFTKRIKNEQNKFYYIILNIFSYYSANFLFEIEDVKNIIKKYIVLLSLH
jgi:hypothetical protein